MKSLSLLTIMAVFLCFFFCTQDKYDRVEYFRHIDDEGIEPLIGKHQVNEETALKINCYRFVYNEQSRLIEVEYIKEGNPGKDPRLGVTKFIIKYENGIEFRSHLDTEGNPISDTTGVYKYKRILDKENNTVLAINYDEKGNIIKDIFGVAQYYTFLNEKGMPIRYFHLNEKGDTITHAMGLYEVRQKYDQTGNVIEIYNYGKDGRLGGNQTFGPVIYRSKFDKHGNWIEGRVYGSDGKLANTEHLPYAVRQSKYDEKGNKKEEFYYDNNNKLLSKIKFYKNGSTLESWSHMSFAQPKIPELANISYLYGKFDKNGSLIELSYHDEDEKLMERDDNGIAIERYEYNEKGEITKIIGLDKNENIVFEK